MGRGELVIVDDYSIFNTRKTYEHYKLIACRRFSTGVIYGKVESISKSLVIDLKTQVLSRYCFVEVDLVVTPILDIRLS